MAPANMLRRSDRTEVPMLVCAMAIAAGLGTTIHADDDYEFRSPTAIYAEGFPGLDAEPALGLTIEPVDGYGGFDNAAPRLGVETGPGGQVWDPSPTYRTRYKQAEYPAGSGQLQGNNWFTSLPSIDYAGGQNPCKVRFDAHTFRVFSTTDGVTWTGQYASKYAKLVKNGNDFYLYDADGQFYLFPALTGYRCTLIDWVGGARTSITYNGASDITVLQQSSTSSGSEVRRILYVLAGDRIDRIDIAEKEGAQWKLYRRIDFTYHENVSNPQESSTGDLVGIEEATRLSVDCTDPCAPDDPVNASAWLKRRWAFKYWTGPNGTGGQQGDRFQVRTVLGPDSVGAWQAANPSAVIYEQTTQSLMAFVDRTYTYFTDRRLNQLELKASCGCGGQTGVHSFEWPLVIPPTPSDMNTWAMYLKVTLPNGSARIFNYNKYGQRINAVAQAVASDSTSKRWIEAWTHDSVGRLSESFSYGACDAYTDATHAVVTNNTHGSRVSYSVVEDWGSNPKTVKTTFKLREPSNGAWNFQGVSTYFLRESGNLRRFLLNEGKRYPTQQSSDTGAVVTTFAYTYHDPTHPLAVKQRTTTLPAIPAGENGSGSAVQTLEYFEQDQLLTWSKDGAGFIHYTGYDPNRRTVSKRVVDVQTLGLPSGGVPAAPPGWTTPAGGGLHLVTDLVYDRLRRMTKEEGPAFNAFHAGAVVSTRTTRHLWYTKLAGGYPVTLAYQHIDSTFYPAAVAITVMDLDGKTVTSALGDLNPGKQDTFLADDFLATATTVEGAFQGTIRRRTESAYDGDNLAEERVWTDADNPNAPAALVTSHVYDSFGRRLRTTAPTGTVTRWSYDSLDRVTKTEIGTDAGNPGNMTTVSESSYDHDEEPNPALRDKNARGQLTRSTAHVSYLGTDARITDHRYDYRGRQTETLEPEGVKETRVYTNRDLLEEVKRWQGTTLLSRTKTYHDAWGQAYRVEEYGVENGSDTGTYAASFHWREARGLTVKTRRDGKVLDKREYDGAGREKKRSLSYDISLGEASYSAALNLTNDTVIEQVRTAYDPTGAVELGVTYKRRHDTAATGDLTVGSGGSSRPDVEAAWYDKLHRRTHLVTYGSYGNSVPQDGNGNPSRPAGAPPAASSSTSRVRQSNYTTLSQVQEDIDTVGMVTRLSYDDVGRTIKKIERYLDGASGPNSDEDRTTEYLYDPEGRMSEVKATLAGFKPSTQTFFDIRTGFEYGITRGLNPGDSLITSNDLPRRILHPDPDSGVEGQPSLDPQDQETLAYNALGEVIWRKGRAAGDGSATVHQFTRDARGRVTADEVLAWETGLDQTTRKHTSTYDGLDRQVLVTSWKLDQGSLVVANERKSEYGRFSILKTSWQDPSASVTTGSPKVQYGWQTPTNGDVGIRVSSVTYPSGRVITNEYSAGTDTTINRITGRSSSGTWYFQDSYLGARRLVERLFSGTAWRWSLVGTDPVNNDNYSGLDRFEVIDDLKVTNGSTNLNRYLYTHNHAAQILTREDLVGNVYGSYQFSEAFAYDGLGRLTDHKRGVLYGTPVHHECWVLDRGGNPAGYFAGAGASCGQPQQSEFNASHEITKWRGDSSYALYNGAGDMTRRGTSQPTIQYDAWSRPVSIQPYGGTATTLEYSGCGQITRKGGSPGDRFYYYAGAQLVEEHSVGGGMARWYVHGPQGVDDIVVQGDPYSTQRSILDANGNVVTQIDAAGTVLWRQLYDAYGTPKRLSSDWLTQLPITSDDHLFTARQWHYNTGQYDYRARRYDPQVERFLTADPLGSLAVPVNYYNSYLYVANDPQSASDPSGLRPEFRRMRTEEELLKCLREGWCRIHMDWYRTPEQHAWLMGFMARHGMCMDAYGTVVFGGQGNDRPPNGAACELSICCRKAPSIPKNYRHCFIRYSEFGLVRYYSVFGSISGSSGSGANRPESGLDSNADRDIDTNHTERSRYEVTCQTCSQCNPGTTRFTLQEEARLQGMMRPRYWALSHNSNAFAASMWTAACPDCITQKSGAYKWFFEEYSDGVDGGWRLHLKAPGLQYGKSFLTGRNVCYGNDMPKNIP